LIGEDHDDSMVHPRWWESNNEARTTWDACVLPRAANFSYTLFLSLGLEQKESRSQK